MRDKVNQWFQSTLCSRLNDKKHGCILLIMQRLHENDMTGFLLNSDMGFRHFRLPVVAEEDEHWEIKRPFSNKTLCINRAPGELLHPARDGEELDAYVLGIDKPLKEFTGRCVAIIHRTNDNDDKLVVVPDGLKVTNQFIEQKTKFQEQWFKHEIIR